MDLSLKPCTTTAPVNRDVGMLLKPCNATALDHTDRPVVDRFSSLPNELLSRILSLLPTKDAAAACSLSKRLRHVFPWITTLDFDASSISHCVTRPYGIQHLPSFSSFVNTVLAAHRSQYLTKFKLEASVGFKASQLPGCSSCYRPGGHCLPDFNSNLIRTWISFPFTRCGLKELDLCINLRVSQPHELLCNVQLPPAIFMCETLESLKLDVNLALDQVYTMPSFCLPNLKLLHFRASLISDDSLVSRLLSSCPLLEDLVMEAYWHPYKDIRICSLSLRKLRFAVYRYSQDTYNDDFVLIDTPNLEDLQYFDEVGSSQYSIINLDHVVKADIDCNDGLKMHCFIRMFSKVKHLCLNGSLTEELKSIEVIDQLPVFHNLKYLALGCHGYVFWDMVLLAFLNRAPVLETLAFPEGTVIFDDRSHFGQALELEQEFFRTAQVNIPECCKFHLKRIVIESYCGDEREVNLIRFLLRHCLVLEELVVIQWESTQHELPDENSMKCTLTNLPKTSTNCSIQVLRWPKALPIVPFN